MVVYQGPKVRSAGREELAIVRPGKKAKGKKKTHDRRKKMMKGIVTRRQEHDKKHEGNREERWRNLTKKLGIEGM